MKKIFKFGSEEYFKKEDVERLLVLLQATHDILAKCDQGTYVKNVLETSAFYDEAECDGYCLMNDIKAELNID